MKELVNILVFYKKDIEREMEKALKIVPVLNNDEKGDTKELLTM